MKLTLKTIVCLCFSISFPAFLLQILRLHMPSFETNEAKLKSACEKITLSKINKDQSLNNHYEVQSTNCNCQHQEVKKLHLNQSKIITHPAENHLLYHSPRINLKNVKKPFCQAQSPLLRGHIEVFVPTTNNKTLMPIDGKQRNWPMTFEELAVTFPNLLLGGFYPGPKICRCRSYNAIVIPYRDRETHLRFMLYYLHRLLQRQQLCYVVLVAEQDDNEVFNKGQLMNTAFEYARQIAPIDCFIFHDVDVIAEDDRILYGCRDSHVVHLAPFIDKYSYKLVKVLTVGAAVGFTQQQFLRVNGFSNEYAGWGGEDDDMKARITFRRMKIWRSSQPYTKFKMIKHGGDPGNTINVHRYRRLRQSRRRIRVDGLSTLDTEISDVVMYITHLRLKIKTYKTGLQRDLARKKPTTTLSKQNLSSYLPFLQNSTGIAIQLPGTVIINQRKKKRN